MKLKLKQWICDTCREVIEQPPDGRVEWLDANDATVYGFKIVHKPHKSPYGDRGKGCFPYEGMSRGGAELENFVGPDGMAVLLQFSGTGYTEYGTVGSIRRMEHDLTDLIRRFTISNYEEARQYWNEATADEFFVGANEVSRYKQYMLKEIIARYGTRA